MAVTLVEKYQNRLTRANNEYRARTGRPLTESKKMLTAQVLENAAQFMNYKMKLNEALDNSVGVQTADIGAYKRFCLDITEATLPNLIAPELCMTISMDHQVGSVMYRKYTAGSRKGVRNSDGTFGRFNQDPSISLNAQQDVIRGTFANGKPQSEYTSKLVETEVTVADGDTVVLRWTPVLPGTVLLETTTTWFVDLGNGTIGSVAKSGNVKEAVRDMQTGAVTYKFYTAAGVAVTPTVVEGASVIYGTTRDDNFNASQVNPDSANKVHGGIDGLEAGTYTISYQYNNEYVPQNDIPLIDVKMEVVDLRAKARRIAIYFSQLAEFEAQKDYGFKLGDDLRRQAEFQIQYEIDTEVVENVVNVGENSGISTTFYAIPPLGVNMRDHYETLAVTVAAADAALFQQTQKFTGTYILVGPAGLRFFSMMNGFKMMSANKFGYGPYVAGELNGKKVVVTPVITGDNMYVGVNTPDASAIVLGIYMPVVPTQMLQYADGGTSQGFSSLYDIAVLNDKLVAKIDVKNEREPVTVTVEDGN